MLIVKHLPLLPELTRTEEDIVQNDPRSLSEPSQEVVLDTADVCVMGVLASADKEDEMTLGLEPGHMR